MITYSDKPDETTVYLLTRVVGHIRRDGDGWRYYPKGSRIKGEIFASVNAVKRSLETDAPEPRR